MEIADGLLYFKHWGALYGKSTLWVTDGKHFTTGIQEVIASEPFVKTRNGSLISVTRGSFRLLLEKYKNSYKYYFNNCNKYYSIIVISIVSIITL